MCYWSLEIFRVFSLKGDLHSPDVYFLCICRISSGSKFLSIIRCIEVTGAYGAQKTDVNISLTAIGLLWTTSDFFARGVFEGNGDTTASNNFHYKH